MQRIVTPTDQAIGTSNPSPETGKEKSSVIIQLRSLASETTLASTRRVEPIAERILRIDAVARLVEKYCGWREAMPAYNRRTREVVRAVERQSERVVVRAGLAVLLAGGSPVGPTPSGVRSQRRG